MAMLRPAAEPSSANRRGFKTRRGATGGVFESSFIWRLHLSYGKFSEPNMEHTHYGVLFVGLIFCKTRWRAESLGLGCTQQSGLLVVTAVVKHRAVRIATVFVASQTGTRSGSET